MINRVDIYHKTGKKLFQSVFNDKNSFNFLDENIITAIIRKTSETDNKIAYIIIGNVKMVFKVEGELATVVFSDKEDIESVLEDYSSRILKRYRLRYGETEEGVPEEERDSFTTILTKLITSPTVALKLIMIGEPNTGKTSIFKILNREEPNKVYIPSNDASGNTFTDITGEAVVNVWDLPGREEHRWLWERYSAGCDIILIVTDSTTPNLLATMESWAAFKKYVGDNTMVVGLANMQDRKDALDAAVVGNILGFKTYPIKSKSLADRDGVLKIFKEICESYILKGLEETEGETVQQEENQLLDNIISIKNSLERFIPPNHPILISINGWIERIKSKSEISGEDLKELNKAVKQWTIKLEELMKS
ncbi:MAG: GTPase domain-containing protein [Candidatus Odinarchaeum yellowstonii]|uniref:GTPase domain-containing protein n=1 Tax=Odinarchaeota yellowstonii (strain LCB_4) TaxID=1841599 RepID=A0AAF0D2G7_ODILC|nr:MAG: GTPase domain-containing protein [Candidatus Odinarchaeum yellowstonii]